MRFYDQYQSQMQRKERKTLTRENYALLFVVCQSKQPLSSYEIKNKMYETRGRYVYEMIDKLVPRRDDEIVLFCWNKIPKKKEKFDLVRILHDFFHLDWVIDFDYNEEALTFKKSHDDKVMTIENANSNTIVVIERNIFPEHEHLAIIRIIIKGYGQQAHSKHVYIRKKGNDEIVTVSPLDFAGSLPSINYLNYYYRTNPTTSKDVLIIVQNRICCHLGIPSIFSSFNFQFSLFLVKWSFDISWFSGSILRTCFESYIRHTIIILLYC
jgi:hypothetical protein